MAGHSKWANIKHRKAAQDVKRGKVFTKIIRELVVAAKAGGPAVEDNPRLRTVVDKALTANMKRDTIDKAIARGSGADDSTDYEEVTYEGYGAGGVAVLVNGLTDNRNRTVAEVRHAFNKRSGNLGTDGSVAYLFSKVGQLCYSPEADEERIIEVAIEAGADDVVTNADGSIDVVTPWEHMLAVKDAMIRARLEPVSADITMLPTTTVPLDLEGAVKVLALIDQLEELDDVQAVYTNADISDEILAKME